MADAGTQWDNASSDSEDLFQRVMDVVEDVLVTLIEAVRERPQVAAAIGAAVVGAAVGAALAGIGRPKPQPKPKAAVSGMVDLLAGIASAIALEERTKRVSDVAGESAKSAAKRSPLRIDLGDLKNAGALVPLALQLLENPVVRGYMRSVIRSQFKKRLD